MLRDARLARLITGGIVALGIQVGSDRAQAQSPLQILDAVRFELTTVDDSAAYYVYRYRVVNPASSRGGVAGVELDLSAPRGTGHDVLPFTPSLGPGRRDVPDHVPFGAIAPERWGVLVDYRARVVWYVSQVLLSDTTAPVSFDSVSAGGERAGFAVRSPYLPGVRQFSSFPTEQSCCTKPNDQGELPNSFLFRVKGFTVAATIRPQDMSLDLLDDDIQQACGTLHWVSERALCGQLRVGLARASAALKHNDRAGAKDALRAFLAELEPQHGSGNLVNDNAYWLLKVNAEYLLAHM